MSGKISKVVKGSIADEIGMEPGDTLLSIDGVEIKDILEYKFYTSDIEFDIEFEKANGEIYEVTVINEEYEELGIEFENPMIDCAKDCTNKCIFCFIDQLPHGMRETMYVKDDDYRLSAFLGNYVTLTNVTEEEINRIISLHLPRINVSVHTTNPELRCHMLNNRFAGNIMDRLNALADAGISLNAQIVLCPGINDGAELDRTLLDLSSLHPAIKSISVVPVGTTKYRKDLPKLTLFDRITSKKLIEQISKHQESFYSEFGTRIVYASDEFYIMAGASIPDDNEYEDYLQIENGVGLVRVLMSEFSEALSSTTIPQNITNKSLVTGTLAGDLMKSLAKSVSHNITVYPVVNDFFGHDITVTGLVTGADIIGQLKDKDLGEYLIVPSVMLRDNVFLDDVSVEDIEKELSIRIITTDGTGKDLLNKLIL
ncbi:MAG: DUF512 domain-containing protein [Eubacteriales bacterium]|nr:DUF512 domain-containing protein [Eubacteriales bacterium]